MRNAKIAKWGFERSITGSVQGDESLLLCAMSIPAGSCLVQMPDRPAPCPGKQ